MLTTVKMSKQIVLISTFCDTEEKIRVLVNNIIKIKNQGFDVAIISPLNLPIEIIEKSDYTFFTKENPILDWPVHAMYEWRKFFINDKIIRIWETYLDYGWAGLTHVKRLGEMFLHYDYESYAFIIYDSILHDEHFELIRKGHEGIVFPSKRGDEIWKVGLHLMVFDKEMLKILIQRITLKDYLSYKDFDAFAYLHNHLVIPLQLDIAKEPVEDEIFFYEKIDTLNHSVEQTLKYFISSPDEHVEHVKVFFYEIPEPIEIRIEINGEETIHTIHDGNIVSTELFKKEIKSFTITYNNISQNLKEKLDLIKNSYIEINHS